MLKFKDILFWIEINVFKLNPQEDINIFIDFEAFNYEIIYMLISMRVFQIKLTY